MTPKRRGSSGRVRVGLFGLLGSANIGNDASMESVLRYLRTDHPEAIVDAMCKGPETVASRYGIPTTSMNWYHRYEDTATGVRAALLKLLGRTLDVVVTGAWVARHDVVIIPGMGTMETTLPVRPWSLPLSFALLGAWARVFSTKVAFVSVGADSIKARSTRVLLNASARWAFYRSYRDTRSYEAMGRRGVDTSGDHVYPDLVFGLPAIASNPGDPHLVGVGVMEYRGSNDDRAQAGAITAAYIKVMKAFVGWLIDSGRDVRLLIGQTNDTDEAVAREILQAVVGERPSLGTARIEIKPTDTFGELMVAMEPVGLVVATRFHNVICALRLRKPVIALSYAPKFAELMEHMALEDFWLPVKSLETEQLISRFEELEARQDQLRKLIDVANADYERGVGEQFSELTAVLFPVAKEAV